MDLSEFNCLNCSNEDSSSLRSRHSGRRNGTISRKPEKTTSCLDKHGRPVPPQLIRVPRHERIHPAVKEHTIPSSTYRRASEDVDDNVVSSSQFADFSVQVYSTEVHGQDIEADYFFGKSYANELESPFSRASMMSSSPYKDTRNEKQSFRHDGSVTTPRKTETNLIAHERSSPHVFASSSFHSKDRKALMKFDHASDKTATLPGDEQTNNEHAQEEMSSTSFSLPRNVRISRTEETVRAISTEISPVCGKPNSTEFPLKETSFFTVSSVNPKDVSPPLTPSRKRVVKKLTKQTTQNKTRRDFAQLYIASMQERRARGGIENSDQTSSHSSSNSSKKSVRSTSSEIFSSRDWREETEELISASNEATNEPLSREDYFRVVFFEESLRRKLQSSKHLSGKKKVHMDVLQRFCALNVSHLVSGYVCSVGNYLNYKIDTRLKKPLSSVKHFGC